MTGFLECRILHERESYTDIALYQVPKSIMAEAGIPGEPGIQNRSPAVPESWPQVFFFDEAVYHQHYADKNRGTYDGYRFQNRANDIGNRANRYEKRDIVLFFIQGEVVMTGMDGTEAGPALWKLR